jgi:hypothetical protein
LHNGILNLHRFFASRSDIRFHAWQQAYSSVVYFLRMFWFRQYYSSELSPEEMLLSLRSILNHAMIQLHDNLLSTVYLTMLFYGFNFWQISCTEVANPCRALFGF